ncbi:MAG: hypothetical protein P4L99_07935, partial [Chthoniobacter sp.]|nr:hypothetical protein [Chthoniobacter sp.]
MSHASQLLHAADALAALSLASTVPWTTAIAQRAVLSPSLVHALATVGTGKFARMRFSVALSIAVYATTVLRKAVSDGEVAPAGETIQSALGVPLSLLINPDPLSTKRISTAAIRQHAIALNISKHASLTEERALPLVHACVVELFRLLHSSSSSRSTIQSSDRDDSTRDELLYICRINLPPPRRLRVLPTSGENERCFYEVIKYHYGWSHEETAQKIADATKSIKTVDDLSQLQFSVDPTIPMSPAEVAAQVAGFLASPDFRDRKWAGEQEMSLLSYHLKGTVAFLLVSDQCSTTDRPRYVGWLYPDDQRLQKLIVMHYGSFVGARRGPQNHYSTIVADVAGIGEAVPSTKWPGLPSEWSDEGMYASYKAAGERYSTAVRDERVALAALHDQLAFGAQALAAAVLTSSSDPHRHPSTPPRAAQHSPPASQKRHRQITHRGQPQASYSAMNSGHVPEIAPDDEQESPSGRPTRGPSARPNRMTTFPPAIESARALERADHRAKTKPTPIEIVRSQPASVAYAPPQYRPRVLVDVPSTCRRHWVTLMQPMFELYGELSAQGQHDQCANVLQAILDMPGKVLIQGEPVRRTLQRIHQYCGVTVHSDQPAPAVPPVPLPSTPSTPRSTASTLSLHLTPDRPSTDDVMENPPTEPEDHTDVIDSPAPFVPPTLDADVVAQLASTPRMDECPTEGDRDLTTPPLDD